MKEKLSRSELLDLMEKVIAHDATEKQVDEWKYIIRCNVPHPQLNKLIRSGLSPEEIIDRALAYQPVQLGRSSLEVEGTE